MALHEIYPGFLQYTEDIGVFNELGNGSLSVRMRYFVDRRNDRPVGRAVFHALHELPVDFHVIDREVL